MNVASEHSFRAESGADEAVSDDSRRDAARISAELAGPGGGTDPFAAAVRATRMPMVVTDPRQPQNPLIFVNDAFCRLTGYARDEILGRNCRFLQGPETDPGAVAAIRAAVAEARSIEIDIRNHKKGGEPFWNRLLLAPVRDAQGDLAYFFASQMDVTVELERLVGLETRNAALTAEVAGRLRAQQVSEAELRHTDRLLRSILETATGLVYAKDRQGRMLLANGPALALIDKSWAEVRGRTDLEILDDPAQAAAVMATDERIMTSGTAEEVEERVGAAGGEPRTWLSPRRRCAMATARSWAWSASPRTSPRGSGLRPSCRRSTQRLRHGSRPALPSVIAPGRIRRTSSASSMRRAYSAPSTRHGRRFSAGSRRNWSASTSSPSPIPRMRP
jgi:PAS domain S-box-containing protein